MTADDLKPPPVDTAWLDSFPDKPWVATITPARLGYWITFHSGLMELTKYGGWFRFTRRGAERCARRVIAREHAEHERTSRSWTVQ
jgi:hypothetical protein